MSSRAPVREQIVWGILAFAGGCVAGYLDLSATEVQGTVLLLMLLSFALAVPGRASPVVLGVAFGLGIPAVHLGAQRSDWSPALLFAIIPALIGAEGGALAGKLLESATAALDEQREAASRPWYDRPLSTRVLLGSVLTIIALFTIAPVAAVLAARGQRAAPFVALVWQIVTFVGWIGLAAFLLRARHGLFTFDDRRRGPTLAELGMHTGLVVLIAFIHAAALVVLTHVLLMPVSSDRELFDAARLVYFPLDALAYVAILSLAYVSNARRYAREAATREQALRAEALDARLLALRARLNPHFLFNALNAAAVLARAGKPEDTATMLGRLTDLLRYVLDERRSHVPLRDELDFARRYLEVQRVRLGDRLRFSVQSSPDADDVNVPALLLQPLVENAVEHGIAATLDGGAVRISARQVDAVLEVTVEDEGPGPAAAETPAGIGLDSTRERLFRLYGDDATITLTARAPRGAIARVRIPIAAPNPDRR
jgi:hypothetical protein